MCKADNTIYIRVRGKRESFNSFDSFSSRALLGGAPRPRAPAPAYESGRRLRPAPFSSPPSLAFFFLALVSSFFCFVLAVFTFIILLCHRHYRHLRLLLLQLELLVYFLRFLILLLLLLFHFPIFFFYCFSYPTSFSSTSSSSSYLLFTFSKSFLYSCYYFFPSLLSFHLPFCIIYLSVYLPTSTAHGRWRKVGGAKESQDSSFLHFFFCYFVFRSRTVW